MTEFEKIYRACFGDVYRYIRGLSGSESVADEITSETFFRAMRSLDRFRGDCDVTGWLCRIAKNCYFSALKKSKRTESLDGEGLSALPTGEKTVEEICVEREEAARARAALHTLPEPYREVFLWRVYAELSFSQIGNLFGKTENWACVTYHRAKTMLQKRLGDEKNEK